MAKKSLIDNPEDIQLREFGEIQQILGHPPGWMLRWGISMIFIATILLFALAWWIKYPDVIPAPAQITTENPPSRVSSDIGGNIAQVLVKDKQTVEQGDLLLILESEANLEDIKLLEDLLAPLPEDLSLVDLELLELPKNLRLGKNIQISYSNLTSNLKKLQYNLTRSGVGQQINGLRKQRQNLGNLNASLMRNISNMEDELLLKEKELNRYKELFKEGAVSESELEAQEAGYLQTQRRMESSRAEIIKNRLEIDKIADQILALRQGDNDTKNDFFVTVKEDIELVRSEVSKWKQDFLLHAPINGSVTIPRILSPQQFVSQGEEILAIVPLEGAGAMVAKADLNAAGSGKVKEGMKVQLRLPDYPYKEFGLVVGTVHSIADVPSLSPNNVPSYALSIQLPEGLTTTYGKRLDFRQGMRAEANIITENRTVLDRIFDRILDVLKNRTD